MEYTQWGNFHVLFLVINSLNPCCNGIYSMSATTRTGRG